MSRYHFLRRQGPVSNLRCGHGRRCVDRLVINHHGVTIAVADAFGGFRVRHTVGIYTKVSGQHTHMIIGFVGFDIGSSCREETWIDIQRSMRSCRVSPGGGVAALMRVLSNRLGPWLVATLSFFTGR